MDSEQALRELGERIRPAGLVLSRFDAHAHTTSAYGDAGTGARFEIGSITKLFTARLLEVLASDGLLRLDEPAVDCLGPGWRIPRKVTLERLATHRSGLPRLPRRAWRHLFRTPEDPYRELTVDDVRRSLPPLIPRPRVHRYSNFGYGVLGHALAARAGTPWPELVRVRIAEPLGLHDTSATGEVSQPHDRRGRRVPPWTLPALEAAGALRATAADVVAFARTAPPSLGWADEGDVRWHNGATGGSCAFVGIRGDGAGVVALANAEVADDLTALAMRLVRAASGP